MRKVAMHFVLTALSVLLTLSLCFAAFGCNGNNNNQNPDDTGGDTQSGVIYEGNEIAGFKLPYSAGQATDDFYDYDADLFYLNETRINGADPSAMYASPENVTDSYEKLVKSWQYLDENGEWQWQDGKSQEAFEEEYGTLDYWLEEYGDWYYLIVTGGGVGGAYEMWRSKDLFDWKLCGQAGGRFAIDITKDDWCIGTTWAPEFIRDPVSGLYFIFFSGNTKNGNAETTYGPNGSTTGYEFDGLTISCAISANPLGPYKVATAEDYYTIRAQKNADGSVKTGDTLIDMADLDMDGQPDAQAYEVYDYDGNVIAYNRLGIYYNLNKHIVTNETPVLSIGYYYMRLATNETKIQQMVDKYSVRNLGIGLDYDCCVFPAIDVNPVIASDGTMMLYFSQHISTFFKSNSVWAIKMNDWISPDWDSMTHISTPKHVSIIDDGSFEGQLGASTSWDEGNINEGTEVLEHNGKWYFTYSPFGYGAREYAPYVAVSDSPTGPFTKLGLDYSPIIGIGTEYNNYMAGTGHHCFITAGDELWILYHCFYNPEDNNDPEGNFMGRCIGADRLYWKYTPELGYDMLYGNGPTYNLQPKPETFTGYTNVAKYATIEGNGDFGEVSYLTDGLFTSQPFTRHWEYGSDEGLLKIKLTWDTPVEIRSFHIYNSGSINYAFKNVSSVMFKLAEKPAWYTGPETQYCYIKDLPTFADDYFISERVVRKGAAAMAEFEPMTVTEMTICISVTLDNDNKYTYLDDVTFDNEFCGVRVSELYIMGNPVNE